MAAAVAVILTAATTWCVSRRQQQHRDGAKDEEDDQEDDSVYYEKLLNELNLMTKQDVWNLRIKYFSKTLSVSYSNTTPLMITKGRGCYLYEPPPPTEKQTKKQDRPYFLDTRNNVAHVGHCHPQLIKVVQQQLSLINTNTRYLHPMIVSLAQKLLQTFPQPPNDSEQQPLTKVFFCNSGSEANDLALRLTRAYLMIQHERKRKQRPLPQQKLQQMTLIVADHAYHGHTIATLDVSPYKFTSSSEYYDSDPFVHYHQHQQQSNMNESLSSVPDPTTTSIPSSEHHSSHRTRPSFCVQRVPCPNTYRGLSTTATTTKTHLKNHDDATPEATFHPGKLYAQHITAICQRCNNQKQPLNDDGSHTNIGTAWMIESGMSVAGVILPPKNYLYHAAKAVRSIGGLYLADEIQTGLGRYGVDCYWGFQYNNQGEDNSRDSNRDGDNDDEPYYMNPIPDIVTVGKGFGNGMPIAAVVCNDKVNQAFEELLGGVEVFNTFGGNPVCAAAAWMVLNILETEQLPKNATIVGTYIIQQLQLLQQEPMSYIGNVRGCGLFIGVEFVLDPIAKIPATALVSWICSTMKDTYRILTSIDGPDNNVLVIKPPMVFSLSDAKQLISSLRNALLIDLPHHIVQNPESTMLQETTKSLDHTPT